MLASQLLKPPLLLPVVAGVALLAYGSGLRIGFVSDDHYWLLSAVQGAWRHAFDLNTHTSALPFETLLHSLKYGLFGFDALGFHLFDLAGHVLACLLLFQVARAVGLSSAWAGAAALLSAVAAAPSQAVYWTSADEHLWATVGALGALVLYIKFRGGGHPLLLLGAALLAVAAALTKVEGIAAFFGVLAYELTWRRPTPWTQRSEGLIVLRLLPFAAAAGLFFGWELTAHDRLRSVSHLGLNMLGRAGEILQSIVWRFNPADIVHPPYGHRSLHWFAALAAAAIGFLLVVCIIAAFARLSTLGLCLIWVGTLLPALSLTDALQSRYTYLPTLITFVAVASGGATLWGWLRARRVPDTPRRLVVMGAFIAILAVSVAETAQASSDYRIAASDATAFSSAVLADHPVLAHDTTIFLIGRPLDIGSARWVFADPRLGAGVYTNVPKKIEYTPSLQALAPQRPAQPFLIYEREQTGKYVERFLP
jgi:hypothetical protein